MSHATVDTDAMPGDEPGRGRWLWLGLAGFFAVLAVLVILDPAIYNVVHEGWNYHVRPVPDALKVPRRVLTSLEDWGEIVMGLCVAFVMWRLDARRRSRVLCLALSAVLVTVSVEGIKRVVGRERPEVSSGELVLHGPARWDEGGDYQSFPSGHVASAAAYSGTISAFYPPLRPLAVVLAAGCGANRIWKERHFASDVWAAAVFGFWFAYTLPRRRFLRPLLDRFDERFSDQPIRYLQPPPARAA